MDGVVGRDAVAVASVAAKENQIWVDSNSGSDFEPGTNCSDGDADPAPQ
jgi:hypothetical protein